MVDQSLRHLELSFTAVKDRLAMKAKKQATEGTPFNDDDKCKRIMNYLLRVCTWNIRTLNWYGASAQLAETFIECGADITARQEMRWIAQECKIQEDCNIYSLPCGEA